MRHAACTFYIYTHIYICKFFANRTENDRGGSFCLDYEPNESPLRVCVCLFVCTCVCVYVCLFVGMCVYVYMCVYVLQMIN